MTAHEARDDATALWTDAFVDGYVTFRQANTEMRAHMTHLLETCTPDELLAFVRLEEKREAAPFN